MNASRAQDPSPEDPAAADRSLEPRPWGLEEPPPPSAAPPSPSPSPSPSPGGDPPDPPTPALLLIDCRRPLPPPLRAELTASLSPAERRRHAALRQPDDRERFLLGRAALRRWLGAWLERTPGAVTIEAGPHGKPHCPGGPEFNLSHSGDLILLALHPSRPVGVDVERSRPGLDWRPIARRVLPPPEGEALERLAAAGSAADEALAADAFLASWCRLEARLKACGRGLAGLDAPRQAGGSDDAAVAVWDVAVPTGYRAAVALQRQSAKGTRTK